MAELPIIFSAPGSVPAILAGTKTQTRRGFHRLRRFGRISGFDRSDTRGYDWHFRDEGMRWNDLRNDDLLKYLRYQIGDILWVREEYCGHAGRSPLNATARKVTSGEIAQTDGRIWRPSADDPCWLYFKADQASDEFIEPHLPWKNPMFMPRWASRITLKVTAVKVERLYNICADDVKAEGVEMGIADYRDKFADLWNSIHGPESWDQNPWVAAYTFERVQ